MITGDSPFKSAPRISKSRFIEVMVDAGSPWADNAGVYYDLIVDHNHDPAVWLAICGREHSFATNRDSVLWRNRTNSWTNARSIRDPEIKGEIIRDPVRKSNYVKYQSVEDSLIDGMYRVDDPTYAYQQAGASTIREVLSIWTEAEATQYTAYVVDRLNEWYEEVPTMDAQIPGFQWHPADDNHFARGRSGNRIRMFGQHYSDGTFSLPWLTTTSPPGARVSAHLLVKHVPTLADRGWQMVRIEDTSWAARSANPFVVNIEYEHDGEQDIPDIAYVVLAQTWLDVRDYILTHDLGDVPINRDGVRGHRELPGNDTACPDGIDVDRIVRLMKQREGAQPMPTPTDPPAMPQTVPDPWGEKYWIPVPFVDEIKRHDWMLTGYAVSEAFVEDDKIVQYFERARLEIQPDGSITRGLVGIDAMLAKYPARAQ